MNSKLIGLLLLSLGLFPSVSISTQTKTSKTAPVALAHIIEIPGNPLVSSDIAWVDPGTKRFYLADRSNFGIDIISAHTYKVLGHITFEGATGLEQSAWIPELHRFTISVSAYANKGGTNNGFADNPGSEG